MKAQTLAAVLLAASMAVASCSKDGDIIYTTGADEAVLDGTNKDIVLDKDHLDALVLTVYWNENGDISLSDPEVAAPANAAVNVLQMASDEAFTTVYEETMGGGVYCRQFTCRELNSLMSRIGIEGGATAPVYVRIKTTLGENVNPKFSNVLSFNVTPYYIDMTRGYVLDASKNDTGMTLANKNLDGVYTGFMGAGSWYNWWLLEGNNVTWGNLAVDGKPFYLDNTDASAEVWNFWFPGVSGCYYVIVDTPAMEWSALLIPELNLGGDLTGAMTYDRKANKWTYTFNAEAKTYNVTLSGAAKQYNVTTGTDDAAAIDCTAAFGGTPEALTFGSAAQSIALTVASAGETTLTLDLNDPYAWTLTAGSGGVEPIVEVAQKLYLSGVYGDWNWEWYLRLCNEDYLEYAGVLPVNSQWGYRVYPEMGAWDNYYSMTDESSAFEGKLALNGNGNVAAPDPGIYLFDFKLSALTYKLYAVNSVSYTGLNDDWGIYPMAATETPGVYTAVVQKTANTPWGVKILINDSWDLYFGGGETPGELYFAHEGFKGDNELPNGPYTLTVDLAKGTYSYTSN